MDWKVGDWVTYKMEVGQIKRMEDGVATFSDGWCETSGRIADGFRPRTLLNKRTVEYFDVIYKRLDQIDGHAGFNFPDICRHFSALALKAIDAGGGDEAKQYFEAANEFVNEARNYSRVIQGVSLFRRAA